MRPDACQEACPSPADDGGRPRRQPPAITLLLCPQHLAEGGPVSGRRKEGQMGEEAMGERQCDEHIPRVLTQTHTNPLMGPSQQ